MKKECASLVLAAILTLGGTGLTHATSIISYSATDLVDVNVGEDLWQYTYTVSGDSFAAGTGFVIEFEQSLFALSGSSPISPNSDWDVYTYESPYNPDIFVYDAYAMNDNASLTDTFTVTFVWTGGTEGPGSQLFNVYDQNFAIQQWGETAPVPEPGTVLLLATGLAGLAAVGRRKRPHQVD